MIPEHETKEINELCSRFIPYLFKVKENLKTRFIFDRDLDFVVECFENNYEPVNVARVIDYFN